MADIKLLPAEKNELIAILTEFEGPRVRRTFEDGLGLSIDSIAPGATPETAAAKLIDWAEAQSKTAQLLTVLHFEFPKVPRLIAFIARISPLGGLSPEQKLNDLILPTVHWETFGFAMLERGRQICRVEVNGKASGTGVLVGVDRVLTAFHVLSACIDVSKDAVVMKPGMAQQIVCRFDYLELRDGTISNGTPVHAAKDWLVAASDQHPDDGKLLELSDPPACTDRLDYVLIRLERDVGREPIKERGGAPRSWVNFVGSDGLSETVPYEAQSVVMGQCPGGAPLQVDVGSIVSLNKPRSRVRYTLNTLKGSSGSPCFDKEFKLVAIHNASITDPTATSLLNQGVSIQKISEHLKTSSALNQPTAPSFVPLWELPSGDPVLGRAAFQARAWAMRLPESPHRFIAVTGAEAWQRNFSLPLLRSIFAARGDVVVDADIEAIQLKPADEFLLDLARELKLPLEDQPPRPTDRQASRWASTLLFDWFRSSFAKKYATTEAMPVSIWYALKNFDSAPRPFKDEETSDLVQAMMRGATEMKALRWLLIGAAPDPVVIPPAAVFTDALQLPTTVECEHYLIEFATAHAKQTPPQTLAAVVTALVAGQVASGKLSAELLTQLLRNFAKTMA